MTSRTRMGIIKVLSFSMPLSTPKYTTTEVSSRNTTKKTMGLYWLVIKPVK